MYTPRATANGSDTCDISQMELEQLRAQMREMAAKHSEEMEQKEAELERKLRDQRQHLVRMALPSRTEPDSRCRRNCSSSPRARRARRRRRRRRGWASAGAAQLRHLSRHLHRRAPQQTRALRLALPLAAATKHNQCVYCVFQIVVHELRCVFVCGFHPPAVSGDCSVCSDQQTKGGARSSAGFFAV